jgi:hypothetical protein
MHTSGNYQRETNDSFPSEGLNRHSPDSGYFGARIAHFEHLSNGKSPSPRAKGDRGQPLMALER